MLEARRPVYKLLRELRSDWAKLWRTKYDDDARAENVSSREFERLFVERGEVINATRDYKPLSFGEILARHIGPELACRVDPEPTTGGWTKFIREHVQKLKAEKEEQLKGERDIPKQQRKRGHGWLNRARTRKKTKHSRSVD